MKNGVRSVARLAAVRDDQCDSPFAPYLVRPLALPNQSKASVTQQLGDLPVVSVHATQIASSLNRSCGVVGGR